MRSAASCGQPLQVSEVPRGALMIRVTMAMTVARRRDDRRVGKLDLKKRRERCQFEKRNIFYLTGVAHAFSTARDAMSSHTAAISGAGARSTSSIGTRDRTSACTRASAGDVSSG